MAEGVGTGLRRNDRTIIRWLEVQTEKLVEGSRIVIYPGVRCIEMEGRQEGGRLTQEGAQCRQRKLWTDYIVE